MKRIESTKKESIALSALLGSKPQIDQKMKYYKGVLEANNSLYDSIQERIENGGTIKKNYLLGFIPVKTKYILDSLDIARLELELQEIEDKAFNLGQYYKGWMNRNNEYNKKVDEITRECNANFDAVLKEAKTITKNFRLQNTISEYKNESNDQDMKNGFYLTIKQEINNRDIHKK